MPRRPLVVLALLAGCFGGRTGLDPGPAWRSESPGASDCERWLSRASQAKGSRWQARANWRWSRCLVAAHLDPAPALTAMAKEQPVAPYLSDAIAEALADHRRSVPERLALAQRLKPLVAGEAAAALAWGQVDLLPPPEQPALLRTVIEQDPHGWRGRHARVRLAQDAEPAAAAALLEAAVAPHRGVLASLGHSEFAGSLETAGRWLALCKAHPDLGCRARAEQRLSELQR